MISIEMKTIAKIEMMKRVNARMKIATRCLVERDSDILNSLREFKKRE